MADTVLADTVLAIALFEAGPAEDQHLFVMGQSCSRN